MAIVGIGLVKMIIRMEEDGVESLESWDKRKKRLR